MAVRRRLLLLAPVALVLAAGGCTPEVSEGTSYIDHWLKPALEVVLPAVLLVLGMVFVGRLGFRLLPRVRPLPPPLRHPAMVVGIVWMFYAAAVGVALTVDWPRSPDWTHLAQRALAVGELMGVRAASGTALPDLNDAEEGAWSVGGIVALGALTVALLVFLALDAWPITRFWLSPDRRQHRKQAPVETGKLPLGGWVLPVALVALIGAVGIAGFNPLWQASHWRWLVWAVPAVSTVLVVVAVIYFVHRRHPLVWAVAAAVAVAVILPLWTYRSVAADNNSRDLALLATTVFIGAVGTALFGWFEASRIRLRIDVYDDKGKEDNAAAAQCVERVLRLGQASPEVGRPPQASNVVDLPEDALEKVPNGQWAILAAYVMNLLVRPITWRAAVTVTSVDQATVVTRYLGTAVSQKSVRLSWLGWTKESAEIEADTGSGTPDRAHATEEKSHSQVVDAAAAVVLMALTEKHEEFKPGLCGATRWESIAAHTLAQEFSSRTDARSKDTVVRLLKRAYTIDPENKLATSAFFIKRFGDPQDPLKQRQLLDRLEDLYRELTKKDGKQAGYQVLKLQILFVLAALNFNLGRAVRRPNRYLINAGYWAATLFSWMRRYDHDQDQEHRTRSDADVPRDRRLCEFVWWTKPDAFYLLQLIGRKVTSPWFAKAMRITERAEWQEGPWSPSAHMYCASDLAERGAAEDKILAHLALVVGDPEWRDWVVLSPVFAPFLGREAFRDLLAWDVDQPPFLELAPFKAHRHQLERAGVNGARELRYLLTSADWNDVLEDGKRLPSALIEDWWGLTVLHDHIELWQSKLAASTLEMLLEIGIRRPDQIKADAAKYYQQLTRLAAKKSVPYPDEEDFEKWGVPEERPVPGRA
jgi:hypothetical protein